MKNTYFKPDFGGFLIRITGFPVPGKTAGLFVAGLVLKENGGGN
jgi:hypothetical protein